MKETLAEINELQKAGIIGAYAIGGAMGATFYLEPINTYDLDIFVIFEDAPLILTLTPIYDHLAERGYKPEGDAVRIGDWPVQFLPAESPLLAEAVDQAVSYEVEEVVTKIMTAEHLMAIALDTGRAKDLARIEAFLEAEVADGDRFHDIVSRHSLTLKWQRFSSKFQ